MNLKNKKGITGVDVVAAISDIALSVGNVTMIYINTVNKSKDKIRYTNSFRIATNIIEKIQRQPYQYIIGRCNISPNSNIDELDNDGKIFDTKVPSDYYASITLSNTGKDSKTKRAGGYD